MSRIVFEGPLRHRARSMATLARATLDVGLRRVFRRPLERTWPSDFEIGVLFWRAQFNHAFALTDIKEARAYFDSLQTYTGEIYDVEVKPSKPGEPKGDWFIPRAPRTTATMLYFHGGGYAYYAAVTRKMVEMLAHWLGIRIFAPDYRLTPEHPHPAQVEDALAAFRYLQARGVDAANLVIAGDSAGGHLALMTPVALRAAGLPQPALAIGLCPWTDVGARGASMTANNRYDVVQGYMALKFGEWLQGETGFSREQLSPVHQDYCGLAPLYLQGGGREMLIDMIRDFAGVARDQGADVMLDVWENMTHDFHAHGRTLAESSEALDRIVAAIRSRTEPNAPPLTRCARTEIDRAPKS